jgi:hypothetical protein
MRNPGGKNYTLGRGKLYFAMFLAGTMTPGPQRYFGNTPEFSTSTDSEELEHFDADNGINEKDDSVTLSHTRSGSFTTDNISLDNVAMMYLGTSATYSKTSGTAVVEKIIAKKGRYYQLGKTDSNPSGTRHITNVVITGPAAAVTVVPLLNNVELDLEAARLYIEVDSEDFVDGSEYTVTYDQSAYTQNRVISSSQDISGELFFEATNPKGLKFDYTWPYAKLTPNGDFNLKSGDDWMTIPFNVEFLKKSGMESVYIADRAVTVAP